MSRQAPHLHPGPGHISLSLSLTGLQTWNAVCFFPLPQTFWEIYQWVLTCRMVGVLRLSVTLEGLHGLPAGTLTFLGWALPKLEEIRQWHPCVQAPLASTFLLFEVCTFLALGSFSAGPRNDIPSSSSHFITLNRKNKKQKQSKTQQRQQQQKTWESKEDNYYLKHTKQH